MKTLTASDRRSLIRLASTLPKGSKERRAILAGLSKAAMEHASEEARKKYLKDHPNADPSKHTVGDKSESKGDGKGRDEPPADAQKKMVGDSIDKVWGESWDDFTAELDDDEEDAIEALVKKVKGKGIDEALGMLYDASDKADEEGGPMAKALRGLVSQFHDEVDKAEKAYKKASIHRAACLPRGSEERRAILAGLQAMRKQAAKVGDAKWDQMFADLEAGKGR